MTNFMVCVFHYYKKFENNILIILMTYLKATHENAFLACSLQEMWSQNMRCK